MNRKASLTAILAAMAAATLVLVVASVWADGPDGDEPPDIPEMGPFEANPPDEPETPAEPTPDTGPKLPPGVKIEPKRESIVTAGGEKLNVLVLTVLKEGVLVEPIEHPKLYTWNALEPRCAYEFYKRLFKPDDAEGHLKVAQFCAERQLMDEARAELVEAKRLNPALKDRADRMWAEAQGDAPPLSDEELKKVLDEQRSRGEAVQNATGQRVYGLETDHFVIYTTFGKEEHGGMKSLCEKLYKGLDRIFEISKNMDRMWDGKAVLYFFRDRDGFVKFSNKVHDFAGESAGGYFLARGGQCEVVIPNLAGAGTFKETMVHEGTHAFLHFYRSPGRVPRWVQEGTAQYFEFSEFPNNSLKRRHERFIINSVRSGKVMAIDDLEKSDRPSRGTDIEGYAWCYNYVSFLIFKDSKKYADFVRGMKSGQAPEEALKKSFGWDYKDLQDNWYKAVGRHRK